jgi:hypothetical protein
MKYQHSTNLFMICSGDPADSDPADSDPADSQCTTNQLLRCKASQGTAETHDIQADAELLVLSS